MRRRDLRAEHFGHSANRDPFEKQEPTELRRQARLRTACGHPVKNYICSRRLDAEDFATFVTCAFFLPATLASTERARHDRGTAQVCEQLVRTVRGGRIGP